MGKEYSSKRSLMNALRERYGIDEGAAIEAIDASNPTPNSDSYSVPNFSRVLSERTPVAMIRPTQDIGNVYASDGGYGAVMKAREESPNFPRYDKMAKAIYDNSAKYAGQAWTSDNVKDYNNRMSVNEPDRNIVVRKVAMDGDVGGYYDPSTDSITVKYGKMNNNNYAARHEIVHSAQGRGDIRGINILKTIPKYMRGEYDFIIEASKGKLDKYNTSSTELHANIAGIQQAIRSTGVPLKTEKDIDNYLNLVIQDDGAPRPQIKEIDADGKYKDNSNDDDSMYSATEALLAIPKNNQIIQQGIKKGIPVKEILKALLMTTAKNEQAPAYQQNSAIDNGIDIS